MRVVYFTECCLHKLSTPAYVFHITVLMSEAHLQHSGSSSVSNLNKANGHEKARKRICIFNQWIVKTDIVSFGLGPQTQTGGGQLGWGSGLVESWLVNSFCSLRWRPFLSPAAAEQVRANVSSRPNVSRRLTEQRSSGLKSHATVSLGSTIRGLAHFLSTVHSLSICLTSHLPLPDYFLSHTCSSTTRNLSSSFPLKTRESPKMTRTHKHIMKSKITNYYEAKSVKCKRHQLFFM